MSGSCLSSRNQTRPLQELLIPRVVYGIFLQWIFFLVSFLFYLSICLLCCSRKWTASVSKAQWMNGSSMFTKWVYICTATPSYQQCSVTLRNGCEGWEKVDSSDLFLRRLTEVIYFYAGCSKKYWWETRNYLYQPVWRSVSLSVYLTVRLFIPLILLTVSACLATRLLSQSLISTYQLTY